MLETVEKHECGSLTLESVSSSVPSDRAADQFIAGENMEQFPFVSVGLPVFNGAATITIALESLIRQEYPNLKIIISDNASTDDTLPICERFAQQDSRIRIIRKQINEGAVANFRTVLDAADSEFFMWAAADDYWYPQFISHLLVVLKTDGDAGVAMCALDRQLPDGSAFDCIRFVGDKNPNGRGHQWLLSKILSGAKYNLFIYGLFRTSILQRAMRHFPEVLGGDRQFIAQMALTCQFVYLDEILLTRTHQPKNFDAYREKMAKTGVLRQQMLSFAGMILGSSVIPWWRKLCLPVALMQYFLFGIRQKQLLRLNMLKKIAQKFYLPSGLLLAAIGFLSISTAASWQLVYLKLISLEFGICILLFPVLSLATLLLMRRQIIRSQKSIVRALSVQNEQTNCILREMRYLADILFHPELAIVQLKDNQLSNHVVQRVKKHQNVVKFVRNLEESKIREVYVQELFPGIERQSVPMGAIND